MMHIILDVAGAPGRSPLVVTHDNRLREFSDRVAHMEDATVVDVGTGAAVRAAAA